MLPRDVETRKFLDANGFISFRETPMLTKAHLKAHATIWCLTASMDGFLRCHKGPQLFG
jgi:hypothetical protein